MSHPCARMELPAARPRPRPQNPSTSGASHETGAFRTSVWETVLQLGLDVNPSVANWIFDTQHEVRAVFVFRRYPRLPVFFFWLLEFFA